MLDELVKSVLVLAISFAVRWFFGLIGLALDDATFAAIVGAIVTYFLALLGYEASRRAAPKYFKAD